jgi:hypothetical protein
VPCQHQVKIEPLCPVELIRRVGQQDPQPAPAVEAHGTMLHVGRRYEPRQFVACQDQRLPTGVDSLPLASQIDQPACAKLRSDPFRVDPHIVIAQDEKDAVTTLEFRQRSAAPLETIGVVEQVAGDRHEVGLQLVCLGNNLSVKVGTDPTAHVEIGQMGNRQAVEGRVEPPDGKRLPVEREMQGLVAW